MTFRERLALALALASIGWGVVELLAWRHGPQKPAWAASLAPLRGAPLPPGQGVEVVLPAHLTREQRQRVLMELYWQFPAVRWSLAEQRSPRQGWVLAAPGVFAPGVQAVWTGDGWVLGRQASAP